MDVALELLEGTYEHVAGEFDVAAGAAPHAANVITRTGAAIRTACPAPPNIGIAPLRKWIMCGAATRAVMNVLRTAVWIGRMKVFEFQLSDRRPWTSPCVIRLKDPSIPRG